MTIRVKIEADLGLCIVLFILRENRKLSLGLYANKCVVRENRDL